MPRRSRTERQQRAWQAAEEVGFRACSGEGEAHAAGGLDDAGCDFQETKTQRRERGSGQFRGFGNGVAHGQHQPISGGMEYETNLVGERRTAAGAIGGELCLMQLDQILGLAARAIQAVVDPLGRADIEAGDDEADVEAELRRLNTGDGASFAIPGLCLVAGLGIAAQNSQILDGASCADVVGDLVDFSGERLGARQAEDVVDAVVLAPRHRLRPSIVPVATERNSRLVPSRPDMPYQAAQMGPHLDAARRLARPQDDRHGAGSPRGGIGACKIFSFTSTRRRMSLAFWSWRARESIWKAATIPSLKANSSSSWKRLIRKALKPAKSIFSTTDLTRCASAS